eukprot:scaffold805_cov110-Isochrysis_galbana.AAC.5
MSCKQLQTRARRSAFAPAAPPWPPACRLPPAAPPPRPGPRLNRTPPQPPPRTDGAWLAGGGLGAGALTPADALADGTARQADARARPSATRTAAALPASQARGRCAGGTAGRLGAPATVAQHDIHGCGGAADVRERAQQVA